MKVIIFLKLIVLLVFASSCGNDPEPEPACAELSASFQPTSFQELFLDLAFDQEFGQSSERLRKWNEEISVFIEGEPTEQQIAEVDEVLSELNALGTRINIGKVTSVDAANLRLFMGAKEDYVALVEPAAAGIAEGNSGFATIAWNNNNEIIRASACIDIFNTTDEELKHIIREELAQTLGLINDTVLDEGSIFHQFISEAVAYSDTDEALIALMLGSDLRPGMCQVEVLEVVR